MNNTCSPTLVQDAYGLSSTEIRHGLKYLGGPRLDKVRILHIRSPFLLLPCLTGVRPSEPLKNFLNYRWLQVTFNATFISKMHQSSRETSVKFRVKF